MTMKPAMILFLTVALVAISGCEKCSAQLFNRPAVVGINWDAACAMESAASFSACRANGGRTWPCAIQAGLDYWTCSGSNFETSFQRAKRVRAGLVGMRVSRRGR